MIRVPKMRAQRGFSMVELMVALAIGLIVLLALSKLFVGTKKSYNTQDALARVQENGRIAMHLLIRDIRMAGYYGCFDNVDKINSTLNAVGGFNPFLTKYAVEGMEKSSGTWYPSGTTSAKPDAGMKADTDALSIRMLDASNPITIEKEMPNSSASLFVNAGHGLKDNDIIMVTDCQSGDLMQLTNVNPSGSSGKDDLVHNAGGGSPGNSTQKLQKSYGVGAKVMRFVDRVYYVADKDPGGNTIVPTLYRKENTSAPQPLVEGVESMQVLYGVDTDGDKVPNVYLKAGAAGLQTEAEWSTVKAVRVILLTRTIGGQDTDVNPADYTIDLDKDGTVDVTVTKGDRNQRRTFDSSVSLRNRT
jgi:type IV pilus assembly protein PilW